MKPNESGSSFRRGRGDTGRGFDPRRQRMQPGPVARAEPPPTSELAARLRRLDRRPYGEYRGLVGTYPVDAFELVVDQVAATPASGAARLRVRTTTATAGVLPHWTSDAAGRLALEDLIARAAARAIAASGLDRLGTAPGSGAVAIEPPGEAILERGSCRVTDGTIELRLLVDLPAQGQSIRGQAAERLLTEDLLRLAKSTLLFSSARRVEAAAHVAAVRRHRAIQQALAARGLVAFFADDTVGRLPASFAVEIEAGGETVRGTGLPAGVTLIAGGALQGKSALLEAIALGVHAHPPGHPRAGIVTVPSAASVKAEHGRTLERADLSLFLGGLPAGPEPSSVTLRPASPALAQAAAAAEAIAAGSTLLLVDEDDSAPSFLGRDGRMQRLVPHAAAGLIPLVDRARDLYDELGVSTIVATSAIGDFVDAAHTTLVVREGLVEDATASARKIATATQGARTAEPRAKATRPQPHVMAIGATPRAAARIALHGGSGIRVGSAIVDLGENATALEPGQRRALGALLARADSASPPRPLIETLNEIEQELDAGGVDALMADGAAELVRPRRVEIAAALMRGGTSARGDGR